MGDKPSLEQRLTDATVAARTSPDKDGHWNELEQLAATLQRPEDVAAVYREVLSTDLPAPVITRLGLRAVRFHDEWFGGDDSALVDVLSRILAVSPAEETALSRLTVVLTVTARWLDLLAVYDRAIEATRDSGPAAAASAAGGVERRVRLLEEAIQVAKDFAGEPDRAIGYLQQLVPLKPGDAQIALSLERLLEKRERWADLIELWTTRAAELPAAAALATRERIATTYLERLGDRAAALAAASALAAAGESAGDAAGERARDAAAQILERILADEEAPRAVRLSALGELAAAYDERERAEDVVRCIDVALGFAEPAERIALHVDASARLARAGRADLAIEHLASWLTLAPGAVEAHDELRELAERTEAHARYVEALLAAAASPAGAARRVALLVEAAAVRAERLGDAAGAIALYQAVLAEPVDDAAPRSRRATGPVSGPDVIVALGVVRRLEALLEAAGRREEQLAVLERMAELEPGRAGKAEALGLAARLAVELGDGARAEAIWGSRLEADPTDVEALDALASLLESAQRWDELVSVIARRREAPAARASRRADHIRIARLHADELGALDAAIDAWRDVARESGEDAEVVDALADLLARATRWEELDELLGRSTAAETRHLVAALVRLGDAQRVELGAPGKALVAYGRALEAEPTDLGARTGLRALLEVAEARAGAVAALARAYERTAEAAGTVELLDARLEVVVDPGERARLLREAAALAYPGGAPGSDAPAARGLGEPAVALAALARALPLAPHDLAIEAELERVATATGGYRAAATAMREAAAAVLHAGATEGGPLSNHRAARAGHLRWREGSLAETELGDPEQALAAYAEATRLDPDLAGAPAAVVRVASSAARWGEAARAVVAASRAHGSLDESLLAVLETAAGQADAWVYVAGAVAAALAAAHGVSPALSFAFETRIASWHHRRGNLAAMEAALVRALAHEPRSRVVLTELADVQRKLAGHRDAAHPGKPAQALHETLLRLADVTPGDLGLLREAAEVATVAPDDEIPPSLASATLERLYDEASRMWARGAQPEGSETPASATTWALEQLVSRALEAGDPAAAYAFIDGAMRLPFETPRWRELAHRAAELASGPLRDPGRALDLYRRILDRAPDPRSLAALATVYEREDQLTELLALRRVELTEHLAGASPPPADQMQRRLALRLEIARLVGALEERGGRVEVLRANLAESPGHEASIAALVEILSKKQLHHLLADLLAADATKVEQRGEAATAASLWGRVAEIAERDLADEQRALEAHRRVAKLAATPEALDALARLHGARGEHALAARWLERRLEGADPKSRVDITLRLARAHLGAGQEPRAIAALERTRAAHPEAGELRELLADRYRANEAWAPLARLLGDAAAHAPDDLTRIAWVREAASLYHEKLAAPERAIPLLEEALRLVPDDRWVQRTLADGLRAAGRVDEARALLEKAIAEFGRRRSPERALVHRELAEVLRTEKKLDDALAQLELASSMNVGDTSVLATLADVAREAGQWGRAEQAYRALLLVVRRQASTAGEDAVGASEVLYGLSRIAVARGEADQAEELVKSAMATAAESAVEARRFRRAVLAGGEPELAVKVVNERLLVDADPREQAELLAELAEVLEGPLGRAEDAFEARLRALDAAPDLAKLHVATRGIARRLGQPSRYADRLRALVDARRRKDEGRVASELLLRLGEVLEQDLGDLAGAAEQFARVEALGEHPVEAQSALARIAGMRGVSAEQRRRLEDIVAMPGATAEARADALYRLADIDLVNPDARERGAAALEEALASDPQYPRAAATLREATADAAEDDPLWALYHRVVRTSGEEPMLLEYLERRTATAGASLVDLAEAIELAGRLEERDREETLLTRAVERARELPGGLAEALWAPIGLARARERSGDLPGAIRWLREAAARAEPDRAAALSTEAADLAAGPAQDPETAAKIYAELLERDPAARAVWEPLLQLLRRTHADAAADDLVRATLEALAEPADRNALRLDHVRHLLGLSGHEAQAADLLRDVLGDEPEHVEATLALTDLLEKSGDVEGLADLLRRQLDLARDRQDGPAVALIALRLASVLERDRREEAIDVLRAALEWGEDRGLLLALLRLLGDEDDPRERAQRMEQLLGLEQGAEGAALGRRLAALWETLEDEAGVQRALEGGHRAAPDDRELEERLDAWYRSHDDWPHLSELLMQRAERQPTPAEAVACFRDAAAIRRDRIGDAGAAADTLGRAMALVPDDVLLLGELVACRRAAGRDAEAVEDVTAALQRMSQTDGRRVALLRLRAELRQALAQEAEAVADLESAFAEGGDGQGPALIDGLVAWRGAASSRGERDVERSATLRLVEVLANRGETDGARAVLASWVEAAPDDRAAIRALRDLDAEAGRWAEVARASELLVGLDQGDDQVDAALRLADACERAGDAGAARPGLERALSEQRGQPALRATLGRLYASTGAHREQATLLISGATETPDPAARFALLREAGQVLLRTVGDAAAALAPLREAAAVKPEDLEVALLLIDACTGAGQGDEATQRTEAAITAQGRRRSPELSLLQHRMARIAAAAGDRGRELEWLTAAIEVDRNNGDAAADLAELAIEIGDSETALKALRMVTLLKTPCRMSRAVAFLRQAQIAHRQGDAQKALIFARRARSEDNQLAEATTFLRQLGEP